MKLDKRGIATETKQKQREKLTQVIEKYDLCDVWRFYPTDKVCTWHSNTKPTVLTYFGESKLFRTKGQCLVTTKAFRSVAAEHLDKKGNFQNTRG